MVSCFLLRALGITLPWLEIWKRSFPFFKLPLSRKLGADDGDDKFPVELAHPV